MDRIVVLDQNNVRLVRRIYRREATLVRSGVDHEVFNPDRANNLRAQLHLENRFVLLLVGYASPLKGQQEALLALKGLEEKIPGAHLILAGKSVSRVYGPVAKTLGVENRVTFMEGFSDEVLVSLYATADVVLFPANQTWGLTVTEAMASARPVIVSNKAGVSEIVQHGRTGLVFDHGNVSRLQSHIEELYSQEALRKQMGDAARRFIVEDMNWRKYAKAMLETFEEAVSRSMANPGIPSDRPTH
jgi:glycosyltransferase involved in cell wall biosynthesis